MDASDNLALLTDLVTDMADIDQTASLDAGAGLGTAAVQDYTKLYCHNAPKDILKPGETAGQQDKADQEKRSQIVALTMAHMGQ